MENKEELYNFLPRHIRKLLRSKEKQEAIVLEDAHLNLKEAASALGTVGSDENYNQYPDSQAKKLKNELSEYSNLKTNQICIGNGSTELVDLILRSFCNPHEDELLCFAPANERVLHFARMNALEVEVLDLEQNFELPIYEVRKLIKESTKVIFIENPNQITGQFPASFDIVDLLTNFEGIVVLDESAIDYATDQSLVSLIESCSNLIVLQTFSRAWGLAGLPVGVAYAQAELIRVLELLKPPFSVNVMAQKMATQALYVAEQKDRIVTKTIEQRAEVKAILEKLPAVIKVHDSETNTLVIEVENAKEMTTHLREEEQIIVLDVSNMPGLENCIRVTIGGSAENKKLVQAIKDMPYKTSPGRIFWRSISQTLRKASVFLGLFKKMLGT